MLRERLRREFPGRFAVFGNANGNPRTGAFEVTLDTGKEREKLWSKLETGEPSHLEASQAVAQHVATELRSWLDRNESRT